MPERKCLACGAKNPGDTDYCIECKAKREKESTKEITDRESKKWTTFEKLIIGLKTGKIDPTKIGQPVDWKELKVKLKCPKCQSKEVEWLLDKNSKEVTFHCLACSNSFWMTKKEYEKAIKKNPDCII